MGEGRRKRRRSRTGRLMAQGQSGIWRGYDRRELKVRLKALGSQETQLEGGTVYRRCVFFFFCVC